MRLSSGVVRIGLIVFLGVLIAVAILLGVRKPERNEIVFEQDDPNVSPPTITLKVPPEYPEAAKRSGKEGTVLVSAVVTSSGTVRDVAPAGMAQTGLEQAAVEAVKKWRFRPGARSGSAVSVRCQFPVDFRLKREAKEELQGTIFQVDDRGIIAPTPISRVQPIAGGARAISTREVTVEVELVVDKDGVPHRVRVPRPVGYGVDEQAVEAVKQWRFTPGLKGGVPVNVAMAVKVKFAP